MKLKTLVAALAVGLGATGAFAQSNTGPVKIGFITDMSSLYADIDGPAGGEMIKMGRAGFRRQGAGPPH
jgi:branched-chain amino acid transport system substrate-binding protein